MADTTAIAICIFFFKLCAANHFLSFKHILGIAIAITVCIVVTISKDSKFVMGVFAESACCTFIIFFITVYCASSVFLFNLYEIFITFYTVVSSVVSTVCISKCINLYLVFSTTYYTSSDLSALCCTSGFLSNLVLCPIMVTLLKSVLSNIVNKVAFCICYTEEATIDKITMFCSLAFCICGVIFILIVEFYFMFTYITLEYDIIIFFTITRDLLNNFPLFSLIINRYNMIIK